MQIGSAMTYAAPLPSSLAVRSPSSEFSQSASEDQPVRPLLGDERGAAPESAAAEADEQASSRETSQQRQERLEITELAARDSEVRAHEQAHASVGGAYAGAPTYSFSRGPDGKRY